MSFPHLYLKRTRGGNCWVPPLKIYFSRVCGMWEISRCAKSVKPKDVLQADRMYKKRVF